MYGPNSDLYTMLCGLEFCEKCEGKKTYAFELCCQRAALKCSALLSE